MKENSESYLDLNSIANGVLAEKIQEEWQKLLDNMQDPNAPFKPARKLVIELKCIQDEKRSVMTVVGTATAKLAPPAGVLANYGQGKDLETGKAYAEEYTTVDARQISFRDVDHDELQTVDGYLVDSEGEIVSKDQETKVVDLRKSR